MSNANPASVSDSGKRLTAYLAPQIVAEDLPAVFPLLAARELIAAFSALFHGSKAAVQVRLLAARLRPRLVAGRGRPLATTRPRTRPHRLRPDPAGVEIASNAGALWHAAGLDWQPWRMSSADLASLSRRKPLSEHDLRHLAALRDTAMPPLLRNLAETLAATGEKGEQEGYL